MPRTGPNAEGIAGTTGAVASLANDGLAPTNEVGRHRTEAAADAVGPSATVTGLVAPVRIATYEALAPIVTCTSLRTLEVQVATGPSAATRRTTVARAIAGVATLPSAVRRTRTAPAALGTATAGRLLRTPKAAAAQEAGAPAIAS